MQIFVPQKVNKNSSNFMQIYPQKLLLSKWFLTKGNRFLKSIDKKMLSLVVNLKNRTFVYA